MYFNILVKNRAQEQGNSIKRDGAIPVESSRNATLAANRKYLKILNN
jgi:hypothetical protein